MIYRLTSDSVEKEMFVNIYSEKLRNCVNVNLLEEEDNLMEIINQNNIDF